MAIQVDTPMSQERLETRGSGLQLMTKTTRKQKSSEKLSERAREAALVARKRRKLRESSQTQEVAPKAKDQKEALSNLVAEAGLTSIPLFRNPMILTSRATPPANCSADPTMAATTSSGGRLSARVHLRPKEALTAKITNHRSLSWRPKPASTKSILLLSVTTRLPTRI